MSGEGGDWRDPRANLMRGAAVAVILGLLIWLVVVETGPNDVSTVGTLVGGLLVLLGFAQWRRP